MGHTMGRGNPGSRRGSRFRHNPRVRPPLLLPSLLGPDNDPRNKGQGHLVEIIQTALINFVVDGDPNGMRPSGDREGCYRWPAFGQERRITRLNATEGAVSEALPHRPEFDVIHKAFRPDGF